MLVFLTRATEKQGSNCWKNGKSSILGIPPPAPDVEEMGEKEVKGTSPIRQMVGPLVIVNESTKSRAPPDQCAFQTRRMMWIRSTRLLSDLGINETLYLRRMYRWKRKLYGFKSLVF
jgi:hypothetical protein